MVEQVEENGQADMPEEESPLERMGTALTKDTSNVIPEWFVTPAQMKAPPGRKIVIMRFRPSWTLAPEKGERQIVCWQLTELEEHQAAQRARGDDRRMVHEMAKQCIRYIDGQRVNWTMTPGMGANISAFWDEIGSACRKLVIHYYIKAHTLPDDDQLDFFSNCITSTISMPAE